MHYDQKYFEWQRQIGEFGGLMNSSKFQKFIEPTQSVLDFGCGGGYLLAALKCAKRLGVEPNPSAADVARGNGVTVFERAADIPSAFVDVVISNHALEHALRPLEELQHLRRALKPNGRLVLVVPCETDAVKYNKDDINQHLYSWSPMCAGNLVQAAGFDVLSSLAVRHRWPPFFPHIAKALGIRGFDMFCSIWARIDRKSSQTRVVAEASRVAI